MDERKPAPATGIFDRTAQKPAAQPERQKPPQEPEKAPQVKERFPDPFEVQAEMRSKAEAKARVMERLSAEEVAGAQKAKEALNGGALKLPDEDSISPEDLKLAEQFIFRGYAERDVEMDSFPGKKFTICATNAEEMSIIDDIAFDMVKSVKSNDDGTVDLPENHIRSMRNALFVALSYRGVDGKELSTDPLCHLNTLKKAIFKMNELLNEGNLKDGEELKKSIKKALIKRAAIIKRLPTPLIDFLSSEKYRFDAKMSQIMNMKGILSKS